MRVAVVAALLVAACGGASDPQPAPPAEDGRALLTPARQGPVVAVVNGAPVYADDLAAQMAARGQKATEALDELIAAELLAQEAFRRGLLADPDVAEARQRELVRALLRRDFEPSFDGPEDVPPAEVDATLEQDMVKSFYDHELYHTVAYVRAEVPKKSPPEKDVEAHTTATAFATLARAARPASAEEFFGLAARLPATMKVKALPRQIYSTTREHGPAEASFARAAFTLEKVGDVSAPARTPWGWDVLYLKSILPEKHVPRAEAEADVRAKIFDGSRRQAFQRWVAALVARHQVKSRPEMVDLVQVDALVGM